MAKRNLDEIKTERFFDAMAAAVDSPDDKATYSKTEKEQVIAGLRGTQGNKGKKLKRINMGFNEEIYDYVKTMARASGITMTDFINLALLDNKKRNIDVYEKAKAFLTIFD